jgi:hypothetical protein
MLPRQIVVRKPCTEFPENPTLFCYCYYVTYREVDETDGRGFSVTRPFLLRKEHLIMIKYTCLILPVMDKA